MKKILFIGNLFNGKETACGQTNKTLLHRSLLNNTDFQTIDIDLESLKRKPITLFNSIKKGIANCDIIYAMPGPRSCHYILPLICFLNKKRKKKIIYCATGTGYVSLMLSKKVQNRFNIFLKKLFTKRKLKKGT